MALLELVLNTVYFSQQCVNRFTFQSTGTPAAVSLSFALWSAFGFERDIIAHPGTNGYDISKPFGRIMNVANSSTQFALGSARVLYSATDFYESPVAAGTVGLRAGEAASPVLAWGLRSSRTRLDIARATKRFVGVSENDVGSGGTCLIAAPTSQLGELATALSANLVYNDEGNDLTFAPVVLGKQRYDPDTQLPSATGRAYRLYPTPEEQALWVASTGVWAPYPTVRTQTSRQFGKGS